MIERKWVVIAMLLLLAGCAHSDTPGTVRQKQEDAAARGREKFSEELVQKNLTWYVTSNERLTGFDRPTGLPEQLITGGDAVDPYTADFVRAHNHAIFQYMSQNGPVPGSFKQWEPQLYHQSIYFGMHQDEHPQQLRVGGFPVKSPDGQYTLALRPSGASKAPITGSPFELLIITPAGQRELAAPTGVTMASGEILFGPPGSDLAFTRWPGAPQPIHAALDLRDGRWLVVQAGEK